LGRDRHGATIVIVVCSQLITESGVNASDASGSVTCLGPLWHILIRLNNGGFARTDNKNNAGLAKKDSDSNCGPINPINPADILGRCGLPDCKD
jgi:hypothetical protein